MRLSLRKFSGDKTEVNYLEWQRSSKFPFLKSNAFVVKTDLGDFRKETPNTVDQHLPGFIVLFSDLK